MTFSTFFFSFCFTSLFRSLSPSLPKAIVPNTEPASDDLAVATIHSRRSRRRDYPFATLLPSPSRRSPFATISPSRRSPFATISPSRRSPFATISPSRRSHSRRTPFVTISPSRRSPFATISPNRSPSLPNRSPYLLLLLAHRHFCLLAPLLPSSHLLAIVAEAHRHR